ncbi:trimeric intracellular cation channel type 1B.1-like [Lytechinus pictus]|uniref:trimeric intracellular cation channel type 1B.1-like n=1 Tax=Lytechinus pictus TaxID=7653 RepID=UPI0030B9D83E
MNYTAYIPDYHLFIEYANTYAQLPLFPFFDVAHYIMMILALRRDAGDGFVSLAENNPLACWVCSMLSCFAGYILSNALLGQSLLAPFAYHLKIGIATIVWYLIFYSPADMFYKLVTSFPGKLVVGPMKEAVRARKVGLGVLQAAQVYPQGLIIMVIIGTVRGSGSAFMRFFERVLRGAWNPTQNELLNPSFTTKATILCSILLTMETLDYIPIDAPELMLMLTTFLVGFKIASIMFNVGDPLVPLENPCRSLLFGKWFGKDAPKDEKRDEKSRKKDGKPKKE